MWKNIAFGMAAAVSVLGCCDAPVEVGGIRPSLAYYNNEGECGTGALVPWADNLWLVTYGPHCPVGGSDKLYQVTKDLEIITRPESVGGTHADRLIHRESGQAFIGTYLISKDGKVRTVPISTMPGRLTGAARHLSDPTNKIYVTDMEEALYELDVNTLATRTLIRDGFNTVHFTNYFAKVGAQPPPGWNEAEDSELFGYHGKGTCSGFGKVFYANNGVFSDQAMREPRTPAGALASWEPGEKQWHLIRTNQFTEVTTRDGVYGNEHPDSNVIWAMGWDAKSIILTMTADGTTWTDYRLPKASHSYDGAHGWNTEWPRIREIGEGDDFLATMHGTFWRFPATFAPGQARGIRPRSTYLKIIGDFCRWNDRVVFGCDDSAANEFMNKRQAKGALQGPERSQSNLWFVKPEDLDGFGPATGTAFVFNREAVKKGDVSAPYLCAGYDLKWLWLTGGAYDVEVDADGSGTWRKVREVAAAGTDLSDLKGEWLRLVAKEDVPMASAVLVYRNCDNRQPAGADAFASVRTIPMARDERVLLHVNKTVPGKLAAASATAAYALDENLILHAASSDVGAAVREAAPLAANVLKYDAGSILYVDDNGNRWRLPYGSDGARKPAEGRVCREICTERDHFNAGGIYYELPAENAHGFAGVRPVTTHNSPIYDYASWRGLFVLSLPGSLKVMAIDDMWKVGKSVGHGGPWSETAVRAGEPSDPYLMNGFDAKSLTLCADRPCTVTLEIDIDGWGTWVKAETFQLAGGSCFRKTFPRAFGGYWVRLTSDADAVISAEFDYE